MAYYWTMLFLNGRTNDNLIVSRLWVHICTLRKNYFYAYYSITFQVQPLSSSHFCYTRMADKTLYSSRMWQGELEISIYIYDAWYLLLPCCKQTPLPDVKCWCYNLVPKMHWQHIMGCYLCMVSNVVEGMGP